MEEQPEMIAEPDGPARQANESHHLATPPSRRRSSDTPPPFSVGHLLLLTTCCGLYLSAVRSQTQAEAGVIGALLVCVFALGPGAAWAGLAVFVSRRWRAVRYRVEPGEWLLAVLGVQTAFDVVLQSFGERLFASPRAVSAIFTACFFVVPALSRKLPTAWKALFCLLVGLYAAPIVVVTLGHFFAVGDSTADQVAALLAAAKPIAAFLLVLALAAWERFRRTSRNWLHNVGVFVFLWMTSVPLLVAALL